MFELPDHNLSGSPVPEKPPVFKRGDMVEAYVPRFKSIKKGEVISYSDSPMPNYRISIEVGGGEKIEAVVSPKEIRPVFDLNREIVRSRDTKISDPQIAGAQSFEELKKVVESKITDPMIRSRITISLEGIANDLKNGFVDFLKTYLNLIAHQDIKTRVLQLVGDIRAHDVAEKQISQPKIETNNKNYLEDESGRKLLERTEIHGDPFNGQKLNREILAEKELYPKYRVEAEGVSVWLSDTYKLDGGRIAVVGFVEKDKKLVAHSFYLSNSQGVWRYMPDYAPDGMGGISWYGKGRSEVSVTLPILLQQALAGISKDKKPREIENPDLIFGGASRNIALNMQGTYYRVIEAQPKRLKGGFYDRAGKAPPEEIILDKDEYPDFSKKEAEWTQTSNLYGEVSVSVFPSKDGNLQYMFCRDAKGRVWVGGVEDKSRVETVGLRHNWILGGDLTTPPYEYKLKDVDQTGGYGNSGDRSGSYVDMYKNYISKIPVIQDYLSRQK